MTFAVLTCYSPGYSKSCVYPLVNDCLAAFIDQVEGMIVISTYIDIANDACCFVNALKNSVFLQYIYTVSTLGMWRTFYDKWMPEFFKFLYKSPYEYIQKNLQYIANTNEFISAVLSQLSLFTVSHEDFKTYEFVPYFVMMLAMAVALSASVTETEREETKRYSAYLFFLFSVELAIVSRGETWDVYLCTLDTQFLAIALRYFYFFDIYQGISLFSYMFSFIWMIIRWLSVTILYSLEKPLRSFSEKVKVSISEFKNNHTKTKPAQNLSVKEECFLASPDEEEQPTCSTKKQPTTVRKRAVKPKGKNTLAGQEEEMPCTINEAATEKNDEFTVKEAQIRQRDIEYTQHSGAPLSRLRAQMIGKIVETLYPSKK